MIKKGEKMTAIFKMVLLLLMISGLQARNGKWQKLEPLKSYPGSAYNLKENVAYMEIRRYSTKKSKNASETLALYRKPLKSYSEDIIAKFKALTPKYLKNADLGSYGNAFFIDTKGKMFQMDMKKDIISLLGEIDTLAEVQLVLWLNHEKYGKYYKKIVKGYTVKTSEPLAECTSLSRVVQIEKSGKYIYTSSSTLLRKGCKKRKHTQFVSNKKINYEYYSAIAMDSKGNLYVIGEVGKNKDFDSSRFSVLEKYSGKGKKLWSRKLKDYAANVAVSGKYVYIFTDDKLQVKYTLDGKKKSSVNATEATIDKKRNISIFGKKIEKKILKQGKYLPEGLPNKKEILDAHIADYVMDRRNNVYVVGSEVFYPSGSPDEVPNGECGNTEQIHGALIAKLDSKGETVWAKVIDRDE